MAHAFGYTFKTATDETGDTRTKRHDTCVPFFPSRTGNKELLVDAPGASHWFKCVNIQHELSFRIERPIDGNRRSIRAGRIVTTVIDIRSCKRIKFQCQTWVPDTTRKGMEHGRKTYRIMGNSLTSRNEKEIFFLVFSRERRRPFLFNDSYWVLTLRADCMTSKSPVLLDWRVAFRARRVVCGFAPFIRSSVLLLRRWFERGSSSLEDFLRDVDDAERDDGSGRGMLVTVMLVVIANWWTDQRRQKFVFWYISNFPK
jgi:hypothetical protein